MPRSTTTYFPGIFKILVLFCLSCSSGLQAQTLKQKAIEKFQEEGFENIRVVGQDSMIVCTIERGLRRSPALDFSQALDLLKRIYPSNNLFRIILLEQGQASYQLDAVAKVNPDKTDSIVNQKTWESLKVDYTDQQFFKGIEKEPVTRPVRSGVTLVIYPQLSLQNMHFKQIYETQFNVAPALFYSGWKGMLLTGQLIFPLANNVNYEGDYIRPGFVTFSHRFRLPHLHELKFTAGNFNHNRYGFDLKWKKHFQNSRWSLGGNIGLTGYSNIYNRYWNHSPLNRITGNLKVSYYLPAYQLRADVRAERFLAGDNGCRVDIYRHYGEITIGFYAVYTGHDPNGGFHFAFPLNPFKRKHQHGVRVTLPSYFDMEYSVHNEFVYDRYYETGPDENRSTQDIYPRYIQYQITNP